MLLYFSKNIIVIEVHFATDVARGCRSRLSADAEGIVPKSRRSAAACAGPGVQSPRIVIIIDGELSVIVHNWVSWRLYYITITAGFQPVFSFYYDILVREVTKMSKFKKSVFTGAATAIITPFKDGKVDYASFGNIIEDQIRGGIDAIVVAGTTGEAATLTHEEHCECIEYVVNKVEGRVPVIAGTGSNDTAYANELSKFACDVGADALLLVTPYYNKATPKGLIKNFLDTAEKTDKPIILYNVPSRTGCNISLPVYRELAKHERIVAVKEASGNISAIAELIDECGDYFDIYSGNDDQIVPIMSLGGKGVISVLSNLLPKETHDICALCAENNYTDAATMQLKYLKLINALFCEVNPIPVKTAMAALGFCSEEMRLPLCEMEDTNREKLINAMKAHGLL